jgi:hypothetical protein
MYPNVPVLAAGRSFLKGTSSGWYAPLTGSRLILQEKWPGAALIYMTGVLAG